MRRLAVLCLAAAAICFFAEHAFAGAWTVPKYKVWGEYYMKWDYAKDQFTHEGKRKPLNNNGRSWEFVQEPKLEYGITDWLNALFSIEYKESHYKEYGRPASWGTFTRKNHGISNIKVGAKWRLIEKPIVFSLQGRAFIYPGYGNYHGDDPAFHNQPGLGHGDDAFELRALAGKRFDVAFTPRMKVPFYWGAETGFRWRSRHVCNDVPFLLEGGFWPTGWLLLKTELDGYQSTGGGGTIKESYGIWRVGFVWEVFGNSILRKGNKLFNIEVQYGLPLWGKNTTTYQEWITKVQTQF